MRALAHGSRSTKTACAVNLLAAALGGGGCLALNRSGNGGLGDRADTGNQLRNNRRCFGGTLWVETLRQAGGRIAVGRGNKRLFVAHDRLFFGAALRGGSARALGRASGGSHTGNKLRHLGRRLGRPRWLIGLGHQI